MSVLTRRGLRPPRFLLLGSAAIVVAILVEAMWLPQTGGEAPVISRIAADPAADAAAPQIVRPTADSFAEITSRPLFVPNRQPQPPDRAPSGPAPPRPNATVLGIVMTGNTHYALIRHGNPPKLEPLAEGQTVDGWRIQTIANDRVTLRSGSATADFPLGGGAASSSANSRPPAPLSQSWGGGPDPDP